MKKYYKTILGLIILILTSWVVDYFIINFLDLLNGSNDMYELYNIEEYKNEEDGFSSDDSDQELINVEFNNEFEFIVISSTAFTTTLVFSIFYIVRIWGW